MSPFELAQRHIGIKELSEKGRDHPLIQWWLSLCGFALDTADETAWCSAFVNGMCWLLRLPRTKSAAARSWLGVGQFVSLSDARPGYDVVILSRGEGKQPGPEVLNAPGHVGFFAGVEGVNNGQRVLVLAGNQNNQVCVESFPVSQLLGVRRLSGVTT